MPASARSRSSPGAENGARSAISQKSLEDPQASVFNSFRPSYRLVAAGASRPGHLHECPPTELLTFWQRQSWYTAHAGQPDIGIDQPLKALVYEDATGKVWLACHDPRWLAQWRGLGADFARKVDAMAAVLVAIATKTTKSA